MNVNNQTISEQLTALRDELQAGQEKMNARIKALSAAVYAAGASQRCNSDLRKGQLVVCRDDDEFEYHPEWRIGRYEGKSFLPEGGHKVRDMYTDNVRVYQECYPYDIDTWHLVGTTQDFQDDYDL